MLNKLGLYTVLSDPGYIQTFSGDCVREIRMYEATADATDVFISNDGKAHLNLITCAGAWNKGNNQYAQRLVVFSDGV